MTPKRRKKLPGAVRRPRKLPKLKPRKRAKKPVPRAVKKKPTRPTKPKKPTRPTKPTKPKKPTRPTKPTKPTRPTKPTKPKKPKEKNRPSAIGHRSSRSRPSPTLVPLTKRELAQRSEQLRLAQAEVARLKRVIIHFKRSEAAKRAAVTRKLNLRPSPIALEPWRKTQHVLDLAKAQLYVDKKVSNVHVNEKGWIVGVDAHGRPMRCWVLINNQKRDTITTRWMFWGKKSKLPKRGAFIEDADYESLQPNQYSLFGVFT